MPVERAAVDDQVLREREGPGAPRFDGDRLAVGEVPHVELADRGGVLGAVGTPLITRPHVPQMPSRQSESKAIGSSPRAMSCSLTTSSISRNDMSGETSRPRSPPGGPGRWGPPAARPGGSASLASCSSAASARRSRSAAAPVQGRRPCRRAFPRRHVREALVVALGLALGRLVLLAEVAAAGFATLERVEREQLGELEEVRHPARVLERLVEVVSSARAPTRSARTPRASDPGQGRLRLASLRPMPTCPR